MEQLQFLNNYDIIEVMEDGFLLRLYDDASNENIIFVTGRCNSNCIMCPSPTISRKKGEHTPLSSMLALAERLPSDVGHLTITGGEPFLAGEGLFQVLSLLKQNCPNTEYLILTNGRALAIKQYQSMLEQSVPDNTLFGIPIHASAPELHDHITQSPGSFLQTCAGVRYLLDHGMRVELRIVVSRLNLDDLASLAKMIANQFPDAAHVSIMGMEMTGSAFEHQDVVWVSYLQTFNRVREATDILMHSGIDVMLYNFPLCVVEKPYWPLCQKSISPDKVRFAEQCQSCSAKDICGGVFGGTIRLERQELVPII